MTASECQVRLHRDALSTPWGFRLQGGKDFKAPLTVQRVFVGSPADGELHRGDVIHSIDNYDATQMIHKHAMDVIKQAGGTMSLRVRRGARPLQASAAKPTPAAVPKPSLPAVPQFRSRPFEVAGSPTKTPTMSGFPGYGQDYRGVAHQHQQVSDPMLNRVQHSLNQAVWNPSQEDEEYEPMCVTDLKKVFNQPAPRQRDEKPHHVKDLKRQYNSLSKQGGQNKPTPVQHQRQHPPPQRPYTYTAKPAWQKPSANTSMLSEPRGLAEPGWSPSNPGQGWSPVKAPQASKYHPLSPTHSAPPPRPVNARPPPPEPVHTVPSKPAWAGSLKSSGGPKPWEMRGADAIAGPGVIEHPPPSSGGHPAPHPPPPQQQHSPQYVPVHQPRVQNVHYGPGASAPEYQQHSPGQHHNSDSAQIKHLQYNSPLGLYSKDNVNAALSGQTQGKPGQGTMQVTGGGPAKPFNPTTSDVYKLLLEEETRQKSRSSAQAPDQSARYENQNSDEMQYHAYMDHNKQSPAMGRLEARIADGTVGTDLGTSDF